MNSVNLHENRSNSFSSVRPKPSDLMVSLAQLRHPASASILSPCFLCLFAKESSFGVPNMEKAYFIKWILEGRFDRGGLGL